MRELVQLDWNPRGKRKRGQPRNTWRRDPEAELKRLGTSWGEVEKQPKTVLDGEESKMAYAPLGAMGLNEMMREASHKSSIVTSVAQRNGDIAPQNFARRDTSAPPCPINKTLLAR